MAAITVALLGGESSGKTTLGLALIRQLNALGVSATLVPEHLRAWCEREGRAPLAHEQAAIAAEQTRQIDAAAQSGVQVVVADTTALVVAAYSERVFNDRSLLPALTEGAAAVSDLTLLMGLDLPWQADGLFREGPGMRADIDALLRRELQSAGIPFQTVYGSAEARAAARAARRGCVCWAARWWHTTRCWRPAPAAGPARTAATPTASAAVQRAGDPFS